MTVPITIYTTPHKVVDVHSLIIDGHDLLGWGGCVVLKQGHRLVLTFAGQELKLTLEEIAK